MIETGVLDKKIAFEDYTDTRFADKASIQTAWKYEPGTAAIGVGTAEAATPKETRVVTYHVKGFTCITCSVGLEVMLRGLNGVTRATASYPEAKVTIGFDEHLMQEKTIKEFLAVCGFTV